MGDTGLYLGGDVGTTGCRVCILSADGRPAGDASAPYQPDRPRPDRAEQDAEIWWQAFCDCVRRAAGPADLAHVSAVCVSGQSTPLLPLDAGGEPLRRAVIWQDNRAAPECDEAASLFGAETVRAVTGMRPAAFLVWPKVLWFMRNEPELFARTHAFATVAGYVTARLTGRTVLDRSNAVGYPLHLETGAWWEEFCTRFAFPTGLVPPVVRSDCVVGQVTAAASAQTGLPAGAAVAAGGMDTACAALAVGAALEGRAFEVTGTSGGLGFIDSRPTGSPILGVTPHAVAGLYIDHAPTSAGGASWSWFGREFCAQERLEAARRGVSVHEVMAEAAASAGDGPTGLLFLPYLAGERAPVWDADARGALVGFELETTRAQVIRAIMEGVAYALRQNLGVMREAGLAVEELRSTGGGSRNAVWCRIKADVLGVPIAVHDPARDAAFGAALLAGIASGRWDLDDVDRQLAAERPAVYAPRGAMAALYAPHFERYCRLYPRLRDLF